MRKGVCRMTVPFPTTLSKVSPLHAAIMANRQGQVLLGVEEIIAQPTAVEITKLCVKK